MSYHIYILGYKQPGALQACESAVRASLVPGTFCVEVVDNTAENVNIHKRWNDSWKVSGAEWMVYLTADTLPQGGWLHEIHAAREVCGPQYAAFGPSTNSCYNEQAGREPAIVAQAPAGPLSQVYYSQGFVWQYDGTHWWRSEDSVKTLPSTAGTWTSCTVSAWQDTKQGGWCAPSYTTNGWISQEAGERVV